MKIAVILCLVVWMVCAVVGETEDEAGKFPSCETPRKLRFVLHFIIMLQFRRSTNERSRTEFMYLPRT